MHTLLLPAGKRQPGLLQVALHLVPQRGLLQTVLHDLAKLLLIPDSQDARAVGHVVEDALGERIGLLEHHADAAAHLHRVDARMVQILPSEAHRALDARLRYQVIHAVDGAQQCALPAARRLMSRDLAARDRHRHIADGRRSP
jgi:hypothetical protein